MKIGITRNTLKEETFNAYKGWLFRFNPAIEFRELAYEKNQPGEIEGCDGLLLTGGGDIHPKVFGRSDGVAQTDGVNEQRDNFEFKVIEMALERLLPVLGICRGMQSLNVYRGGTLHLDLVSGGYSRHDETDGKENRHHITIESRSMLGSIVGKSEGEVNSTHHQGVDRIGRGLLVAARSADGVIEAMELAEKSGMPFLLLVQWHPERMKDTFNPLTEKIGRTFLEEIKKYKQHN
ncbi:MAG: gamma-glutamyl-gamma-aminobutyrate hydrolase family protein [Bacteroidota bacterium]